MRRSSRTHIRRRIVFGNRNSAASRIQHEVFSRQLTPPDPCGSQKQANRSADREPKFPELHRFAPAIFTRMLEWYVCNQASIVNEESKDLGCVISQDELILRRAEWKRNGKRVVFASGAFDLLHPGHVRLIEQARSHGDVLVVGIESKANPHDRREPTARLARPADNPIGRACRNCRRA